MVLDLTEEENALDTGMWFSVGPEKAIPQGKQGMGVD